MCLSLIQSHQNIFKYSTSAKIIEISRLEQNQHATHFRMRFLLMPRGAMRVRMMSSVTSSVPQKWGLMTKGANKRPLAYRGTGNHCRRDDKNDHTRGDGSDGGGSGSTATSDTRCGTMTGQNFGTRLHELW